MGGGYFQNQPHPGAARGNQRSVVRRKRADSGGKCFEAAARANRRKEPADGRDDRPGAAAASADQPTAGKRRREKPEKRLPIGRIRQAPGQSGVGIFTFMSANFSISSDTPFASFPITITFLL